MSTNSMKSMERMFRQNGFINQTFLNTLNPNEWQLTDERGGSSLFWLMAHLAHTRSWSVKSISGGHASRVRPAMRRDEDGTIDVLVNTPQEIAEILSEGDEALLEAVQHAMESGETRTRTYIDPNMILARTFNHNAHHRGQIMSVLRLHGVSHPILNQTLFISWSDL